MRVCYSVPEKIDEAVKKLAEKRNQEQSLVVANAILLDQWLQKELDNGAKILISRPSGATNTDTDVTEQVRELIFLHTM